MFFDMHTSFAECFVLYFRPRETLAHGMQKPMELTSGGFSIGLRIRDCVPDSLLPLNLRASSASFFGFYPSCRAPKGARRRSENVICFSCGSHVR